MLPSQLASLNGNHYYSWHTLGESVLSTFTYTLESVRCEPGWRSVFPIGGWAHCSLTSALIINIEDICKKGRLLQGWWDIFGKPPPKVELGFRKIKMCQSSGCQGNLCCIQQYGNDVSVPARVPSYADAARVTLVVSGVKTQHFGREGHSGHCECDLFMHKCALDLSKCWYAARSASRTPLKIDRVYGSTMHFHSSI